MNFDLYNMCLEWFHILSEKYALGWEIYVLVIEMTIQFIYLFVFQCCKGSCEVKVTQSNVYKNRKKKLIFLYCDR